MAAPGITISHVITGATGFVGSAIALELLTQDPDARIGAIVRPGKHGPVARLRETLLRAARLYGHGDRLDAAIVRRCTAVAGDLHQPRCGVGQLRGWRGAEFWHCAASLQFLDRYEREIFLTNETGTRHALELATSLEVSHFNAISTAYVAGNRSGLICETPAETAPAQTNNHYERSKIAAEALVLASDLPVRVLRPGIVIGHSQTCAALNFNGLYGFLRGIYKFRRLLERTQARLMDTLELRMIADVDATLDLIPVDLVASDAVALAQLDAAPGIYHLTSSGPPVTRASLATMFSTVGVRPPIFVNDRAEFTWLDAKFNRRVDFYNAYLLGDKRFDRSQTDAALGRDRHYGLSDSELRRFCEWYVDHELSPRKPLPVSA